MDAPAFCINQRCLPTKDLNRCKTLAYLSARAAMTRESTPPENNTATFACGHTRESSAPKMSDCASNKATDPVLSLKTHVQDSVPRQSLQQGFVQPCPQ